MWYALLIPIILTLVSYHIWSRKITIAELFIAPAVSLVAILISYYSLKEVNMQDTEYNGYLIVEARYYESWTTWVTKTCSEEYACGSHTEGTGSDAHTVTDYCTRYYDCSYCDENPAYWVVVNDHGDEYRINESKYNELKQKWSSIPQFTELDRDIDYHENIFSSCGKDGDMYYIRWNGKVETSEAQVKEVSFRNPIKVSHSAFKYPNINKSEADSFGLYHYPGFYDNYKQPAILSKDISIPALTQTKFEYINGYLGPKNKVKIFTLLFKNRPIDVAFKQEQYWQGGNQNELVVCIGLNDTLGIDWVKPFSWCDNKRICVDTREDIAELGVFNADSVYNVYMKNIPLFFQYKPFSDFNYLKFEPTSGQLAFVYILTLIVSILSIIFAVKNDINNET